MALLTEMVAVEFQNIQPFGPSNVLKLPMNTFSVSPIKSFNEENRSKGVARHKRCI